MKKWTRAFYQPNLPLKGRCYVTESAEHIALSKEAASEGMVLLKNDHNLLPFAPGSKIAMFGKGSFDYVKGGGGSGDVTVSYIRNLYEGLRAYSKTLELYEPLCSFYRKNVKEQYQQGAAPGMTVEPEVPAELAAGARAFSDTALIVISRFSGEGWDRSSVEYDPDFNPWETEVTLPQISGRIFPKGDFYLSAEEEAMISMVLKHFPKVAVVLNTGGVIDTTWIQRNPKISAALLAWQGGMEGGSAAADILTGKVNPSGKLPDTFADTLEAYPSTADFHKSPDYVEYTEDIFVGYRYFETLPDMDQHVCYPFGFGLSYTSFAIDILKEIIRSDKISFQIRITNTGLRAGKEVIQLYYSAPQGLLTKPARELGAFTKTPLLSPGESCELTLSMNAQDMASFDDLGKICKSCYVLEKGRYAFYIGTSVRDTVKTASELTLSRNKITQKLTSLCAPALLKKRLRADGTYEELPLSKPNDPNFCIFEKMQPGTEEALAPATCRRDSYLLLKPYAENAILLMDVADGKAALDDFISQLSDEHLIGLLGGQPNTGVANTYGFGNLAEYGVPNIMTADGPAGLRIDPRCAVCTTAWPCSTLLASTWNEELLTRIGVAEAEEIIENNISVWLAPAVNIHRNPLCGRNFEYYSEDPYLTGKLAASLVRGVQSQKAAATVKHFACNNKETNRKHSDSRVSERALREIYLKAFEIIVKEADPWVIMTSYNVINGYRASENKQLLEGILRGEWKYNGAVISDWWTRGEQYKEIAAGNDIKMACGFPDRVKKALELGAINRGQLEYCARHVLELLLKLD